MVWIYLILMITLLAILLVMFFSGINSNRYGAPFVPIKRKLIKDLLEFGGVSNSDIFYDLGCGDGRVLLSAAKDFSISKMKGYEVSLWPYLESRFLFWHTGIGVELYRQNFFNADLSDATFIYMYLFPKLVNQLADKVSEECRSGTKILCPSFEIELKTHPGFKLLKSQKIGKITAYLYEKI